MKRLLMFGALKIMEISVVLITAAIFVAIIAGAVGLLMLIIELLTPIINTDTMILFLIWTLTTMCLSLLYFGIRTWFADNWKASQDILNGKRNFWDVVLRKDYYYYM